MSQFVSHDTSAQAVRPFSAIIRASSGMINRAVAAIDATMIILVALIFRRLAPGEVLTFAQTLLVGLTAAASFVVTLRGAGAYRLEVYRSHRAQAPGLLIGLAAAAVADRVLVWTFSPATLRYDGWLAAWTLATLAALLIEREGVAHALRWFSNRGGLQKRVAVIGATPLAASLLERMSQENWRRDYRLVGVFDSAPRTRSRAVHSAVGSLEDFARIARNQRIDTIVIAASWVDPARIFDLVERLQWVCADVVALLDDDDRLGRASQRISIADMSALRLSQHPLRGTEGLVKTALDYSVAALALLFFAPVMAAAALAVRISGPGPILFRQARVGFNGRMFDIYKFRSMSVDLSDDGSNFKQRGDPRITPVGAFLRQTSLDELPQLFNVLRGDMSIVGPRPHVPNMNIGAGCYSETVRTYAGRCQIKPGITGWAQINGMRGGIDTVEKARRGVELDLHYIRNWSLRLDLEIMVKTLTRNMIGTKVF